MYKSVAVKHKEFVGRGNCVKDQYGRNTGHVSKG